MPAAATITIARTQQIIMIIIILIIVLIIATPTSLKKFILNP